MKILHHEPYAPLRAAAYPPIGDQLDAIVKMAKTLHEQGIGLPPEVMEWVGQCEQVKATYKKPPSGG